MRLRITLFCLAFCLSLPGWAQKLSGQWTGGFTSTGDMMGGGTEYVLELEVSGSTVKGYSYTYFVYPGQKRYYVICRLSGSYDAGSKSMVVTEVEKVKSNTPPDFRDCLQTHMLTYMKQGSEESLDGKWKPAPGQNNCGVGETSLKRRTLAKMSPAQPTESISEKSATKPPATTRTPSLGTKPPAKTTTPTTKSPAPKPAPNSTAKSGTPPKTTTPAPKTTTPALGKPQVGGTKEKAAPPQAKTTTKPPPPPKSMEKPVTVEKTTPRTTAPVGTESINPKDLSRLDKRSKQVIRMIEVPAESFTVSLYDNGQIDGDTVSLYYNGKLMVASKRLSTTPITLEIKLDPNRDDNDLVMYAENLGSIPPNTALMVVTVGDKRYEVNITSTEQTSGTVRFRLKE